MSNADLLLPLFAAQGPTDQPGTVTAGASRNRGDTVFAAVVSDPDGITSIDSASLRANDGTQADISGAWLRSDANSFGHTDRRGHDRWRRGTISVTYTDGNSVQSTVTATWDV